MEKRTPHCSLERVKALLAEEKVRATRVALVGAKYREQPKPFRLL